MVSKQSRSEMRVKKHNRLRNRFAGTAERPRLAVFRSNNHMYAQIIDDTVGNTLVAASTAEKAIKAELEKTNNVDAAAYVGIFVAEFHQFGKVTRQFGRLSRNFSGIYISVGSVDGDVVTFFQYDSVNFHRTGLVVYVDGSGT